MKTSEFLRSSRSAGAAARPAVSVGAKNGQGVQVPTTEQCLETLGDFFRNHVLNPQVRALADPSVDAQYATQPLETNPARGPKATGDLGGLFKQLDSVAAGLSAPVPEGTFTEPTLWGVCLRPISLSGDAGVLNRRALSEYAARGMQPPAQEQVRIILGITPEGSTEALGAVSLRGIEPGAASLLARTDCAPVRILLDHVRVVSTCTRMWAGQPINVSHHPFVTPGLSLFFQTDGPTQGEIPMQVFRRTRSEGRDRQELITNNTISQQSFVELVRAITGLTKLLK